MTSPQDEEFGFAPDYDAPIPYMKRTRDSYVTLDFGPPYRWAHYLEVPFTPLQKPLSQSRVGSVTTAAPYDPENVAHGPGPAYTSAPTVFQAHAAPPHHDHTFPPPH